MEDMGIARDIPIVLNSINYEDNYRGDFAERRAIIYTLDFTTKFYLYGPVTSSKVIKTVQVDQYTDMPSAILRENKDIQLHLTQHLLTLMMILDLTKQHLSSKTLKTLMKKVVQIN